MQFDFLCADMAGRGEGASDQEHDDEVQHNYPTFVINQNVD